MDLSELFRIFMSKKDSFENGLVCYNGFSFLFLKCDSVFDLSVSSKFSSAGAYWDSHFRFLNSEVENGDYYLDLFNYDVKIDLLFAGSLKTLVPSLQFGGYERLFNVIIIVRTPDGKAFPITYYIGPSGTAIGGWDSRENDIINIIFANESDMIIRFNPFELSKSEIKELIDALEGALRKVPISDFESVYEHDYGKILMGIRSGKPFIIENYAPEQDVNIRIVRKYIPEVMRLKCTHDGKYFVSGLLDGKIKIWNFETGNLIRTFKAHENNVLAIHITKDAKYIISSSWDAKIKFWDFKSGKLIKTLKSPKNGGILSLIFIKDEKCIISGLRDSDEDEDRLVDNRWIELWDVQTGNLLDVIEQESDIFENFVITPDEKYLIGNLNYENLGIMELKTKEIIKIFKGHEDYIRCIAITPDGKTIISESDDGTTRIWDFNTGKELKALSRCASNIHLTSDEEYLIYNNYYFISIIDFKKLKEINTFKAHNAIIRDLQLTPDENYIIHAAGASIKVWNFKTLDLIKIIDTGQYD